MTGPRGHGKSAVLAHVLAGACPRYRTLVVASDPQAACLESYGLTGPVDAAALGRGSALDVARELAQHLGFAPGGAQELIDRVGRERPGCRIVVDAVDESADPDSLMRELLVPLSEHAAVAIGSLARYVEWQAPSTATWIDLADTRYGDDAIPGYVRAASKTARRTPSAPRSNSSRGRRTRQRKLPRRRARHPRPCRPRPDRYEPAWLARAAARQRHRRIRAYLARFGTRADQERMIALLAPLAHARSESLTLPTPGVPSAWLASRTGCDPTRSTRSPNVTCAKPASAHATT